MRPIPQALKIVAYLFIIGGIFAVIDIVVSLTQNRISINLGVLALFIGRGLLRLNPRSLAWAMFFRWLGLIITAISAVVFLYTPGTIRLFGRVIGQAPPGLGFILSVAVFALVCWEYKVLTRPDVRQLFV
jgi:hypothetical protein